MKITYSLHNIYTNCGAHHLKLSSNEKKLKPRHRNKQNFVNLEMLLCNYDKEAFGIFNDSRICQNKSIVSKKLFNEFGPYIELYMIIYIYTCACCQSFRLGLGLSYFLSNFSRLLFSQLLGVIGLISRQLLSIVLLAIEKADRLLAEAFQ